MPYSIEIKQEQVYSVEDKENSRLSNCEYTVWTPTKSANRVTVDYSTPVTPKSSRAPPRSLWDSLQEYVSLPELLNAPVSPGSACSGKNKLSMDELIMGFSRTGAVHFHPYSSHGDSKSATPKKAKSREPVVDEKSIVKPELGWKQMVVLAIVANKNKLTHVHNVYEFVEKHFPYYPQTRKDTSWKSCVRSAVRKNGIFVKDGENPSYRIVPAKFAAQVQAIIAEIDKSTVGISNLESIQKMLNHHRKTLLISTI